MRAALDKDDWTGLWYKIERELPLPEPLNALFNDLVRPPRRHPMQPNAYHLQPRPAQSEADLAEAEAAVATDGQAIKKAMKLPRPSQRDRMEVMKGGFLNPQGMWIVGVHDGYGVVLRWDRAHCCNLWSLNQIITIFFPCF